MNLTESFRGLESLRKRIGAQETSLTFGDPLPPREDPALIELEGPGIDVEWEDIQRAGALLTYKGEYLAVLYILNSHCPSDDLNSKDPDAKTPRFHVSWCQTIDRMDHLKKFNRYVVSRNESQRFRVEAKELDGSRHMLEDIRLFPCRHCLNGINYHGYHSKQPEHSKRKQVVDFSLQEFLEENQGNLPEMKRLPTTLAEHAKSGGYTSDFPEISRRLREAHNWTCENCGVNMERKKDGLHTHHVDGQKHDNRPANLQVLCALCHRDVDEFHKNMCIRPDIESYIHSSSRPKLSTANPAA